MPVGHVLPFAAADAVHLLGQMIPAEHILSVWIELHKLALHERIESGNIRTHAEGGHLFRGQLQGFPSTVPAKVRPL